MQLYIKRKTGTFCSCYQQQNYKKCGQQLHVETFYVFKDAHLFQFESIL